MEILLAVMRDPQQPAARRDRAAQALMPYWYPKADSKAKQQDCIDGLLSPIAFDYRRQAS